MLIVYNRPELTQRVLERIGRSRPSRLYIAADGPQEGNESAVDLCTQVRALKDTVNWPCELKTWYHAEHLGPDRGVVAAINWFFENEPEGIILEDDCLPEDSFFSFCDDVLKKFRDDNRVMHVCGINPLDKWDREPYGYYYSRHATTGGWATWRRAWKLNGFDSARYEFVRRNGFFDEYFPTRKERAKWFRTFDLLSTHPDQQAQWTDRWAFARFTQSGLSIVPRESLVAHLPNGKASDKWLTDQGLQHPPYVMRNLEADTAFSHAF